MTDFKSDMREGLQVDIGTQIQKALQGIKIEEPAWVKSFRETLDAAARGFGVVTVKVAPPVDGVINSEKHVEPSAGRHYIVRDVEIPGPSTTVALCGADKSWMEILDMATADEDVDRIVLPNPAKGDPGLMSAVLVDMTGRVQVKKISHGIRNEVHFYGTRGQAVVIVYDAGLKVPPQHLFAMAGDRVAFDVTL